MNGETMKSHHLKSTIVHNNEHRQSLKSQNLVHDTQWTLHSAHNNNMQQNVQIQEGKKFDEFKLDFTPNWS